MKALDTKGKEYLSNNGRFADLCNVVLYDGEPVIKAEHLDERRYGSFVCIWNRQERSTATKMA